MDEFGLQPNEASTAIALISACHLAWNLMHKPDIRSMELDRASECVEMNAR